LILRQKIVGWVLIGVTVAYILYFWKVRLFVPGPPLSRSEWANLVIVVIVFMIGTANVRLAAMRERNRKSGPAGQ
jgi:hypothetical protein